MLKKSKPIVGISVGDPNGIGLEVILKSLEDKSVFDECSVIVFSNFKLIKNQMSYFNIDLHLKEVSDFNNYDERCINVYPINKKEIKLSYGKLTTEGGIYSKDSLFAAVKALKNKKIDALVTGPINKKNIQSDDFQFKGHTDFLDNEFQGESLMFMVSKEIKVGLLTEHIPLSSVKDHLSENLIEFRIKQVFNSLMNDFGIKRPKVAVLSIDPHVGDQGVIGNDDEKLLKPVLDKLNAESYDVKGPFASDSFFGSQSYKNFDAIVATYHDQGLIPFKTLTFGKGVNFTAGFDIVRTSPDHGTAYDISGKNIANYDSFKSAMFTAIEIVKNREKN
ncbi:MAG: 4-hydroxythreonine-4-phosphate dehydrogenase PdxA [Flavobacteriaceae bacterium]|nr:4-hydroxythreonine-4-phosphate dehydrogenase PdxA [Flavobacteriaceae bacterium]